MSVGVIIKWDKCRGVVLSHTLQIKRQNGGTRHGLHLTVMNLVVRPVQLVSISRPRLCSRL